MENKLFPSLYITDLREECNEATLLKELDKINIKLSSVIIYRNPYSHQSYGSGKLTFFTLRDAERTLELLNYTLILGRACRLMWFKKDKSSREMTKSNIFIRNLEKSVTVRELYNEFSKYGTIFSCQIGGLNKPPGESKGYAYVQYENAESAQKAINSANHTQIKGKEIQVTLFVKRSQRYGGSGPLYNNLYVKFIPKHYNSEMLKQLFENAGEIISAVVIYEKEEEQENKGFGFVCFKNAEDAKNAETDYNDKEVEEQKLFVCKALSKEERKRQLKEERFKLYKNCNLYLKFLPPHITDDHLKNELQIYGKIISARIFQENKFDPHLNQSKLTSKGYGFVCYSNEEDARNALEGIKTNEFFGVQLYVAIAQNKEDREKIRKMNPYYPPFFYPFPPPMHARIRGNRNFRTRRPFPMIPMPNEEMSPEFAPKFPPDMNFAPNDARPRQYRPRSMGHYERPRNRYPPRNPFPRNFRGKMDFSHTIPPMADLGMPMMMPGMMGDMMGPMGAMGPMPMGGMSMGGMPMGGNSFRFMPPPIGGQFNPNQFPPMGPLHSEMEGENRENQPHHGGAGQMQGMPMSNQINPMNQMNPIPQNINTVNIDDVGDDLQALGEKLYPLVENKQPKEASKITGMLLEMDKDAIINVIKDDNALDKMIAEALQVLERASGGNR